jgi:hypothetical protein
MPQRVKVRAQSINQSINQPHNQVHAATEKLLMKVIPDLAAELNLLSLRDRERYLDLHDVHKGNIRVMLKPNGAGSKLVLAYHYICSFLFLYVIAGH